MSIESMKQFSEFNQSLPSPATNRQNVPDRANKYGEKIVQLTGKAAYGPADDGAYFLARNPTVGTGIAGIAAADGAEGLENLVHLYNSATVTEGTRIYLDYLRLVPTAAGTNGTTTVFISVIDNVSRYTSGGSAITPVNVNMDSTASPKGQLKFGALVTVAGSADSRIVGGGALRLGVIKVIGDVYQFDFGGFRQDMPPTVTSGTAQIFYPWRHAPVVLGPGDSFTLEVFGASQTVAASFEFEMAWYEK